VDFLAILQEIGFGCVELVAETGFNSSPKTKGVLIRAIKSDSISVKQMEKKPLTKIENLVQPMEHLLKRATELGAARAKIIDTDTIVVEKWVRWKCRYGCPMYAKDPYHAPHAPDVKETKEILREYKTAIFLNGPDGKKITEIAVQLEGEAYHMGYYKAFAMTALASDFKKNGSAPGAT
jgi:hypothetical protein